MDSTTSFPDLDSTSSASASVSNVLQTDLSRSWLQSVPADAQHDLREIGANAVWSLSSCKAGWCALRQSISLRVGSHSDDLREIKVKDLSEPVGWCLVDLRQKHKPVRAFMLQLAVLQNHHNGRDTHIRQIKVLAPHIDMAAQLHSMFTTDDRPIINRKPLTNQLTQFAVLR